MSSRFARSPASDRRSGLTSARYFAKSRARSAQRSRASRRRRAASSCSSTAATSALTSSGRIAPSALSRALHAGPALAPRHGRRRLARVPVGLSITCSSASDSCDRPELRSRCRGASAAWSPAPIRPADARRLHSSVDHAAVSSDTRSDEDSASRAAASVCSIDSWSVGAGSSGTGGGGEKTPRGSSSNRWPPVARADRRSPRRASSAFDGSRPHCSCSDLRGQSASVFRACSTMASRLAGVGLSATSFERQRDLDSTARRSRSRLASRCSGSARAVVAYSIGALPVHPIRLGMLTRCRWGWADAQWASKRRRAPRRARSRRN